MSIWENRAVVECLDMIERNSAFQNERAGEFWDWVTKTQGQLVYQVEMQVNSMVRSKAEFKNPQAQDALRRFSIQIAFFNSLHNLIDPDQYRAMRAEARVSRVIEGKRPDGFGLSLSGQFKQHYLRAMAQTGFSQGRSGVTYDHN